jgi:raffinose/stachyose/melibiose transport system substrate-binding protein
MKKAFTGIALAVTIAAVLAGCSDPGAGGSSSNASWPSETTSLKGVNLTLWAAQASNKIPSAVIKGFDKATGANVKVVTIPDPYEQGLLTKIATGDKPDIAFWAPTASSLASLNAKSNLQPLTGGPWIDKTKASLRNVTGFFDKTRYAALISSPAVLGVYYNKEAFAKAGIASTPKNISEMIADAKLLKEAGITPFYDMGGDKWGTQWFTQIELADAAKAGLWDRVNTNKEQFTGDTILGAISNYKSLIDQGLFNSDIKTGTFVDQGKSLLAGNTGMVVQINAFAGELQADASAAELDQKIGFFPVSESGDLAVTLPDQTNALVAFKTGDSKREAAARQLISYWLGGGYATFVKDQNSVSIEPSVATPSSVPKLQRDLTAAFANSIGGMQTLAVANPDLYLNIDDMIQGTKTPLQVAQATQTQFAQLAKAQGIAGF